MDVICPPSSAWHSSATRTSSKPFTCTSNHAAGERRWADKAQHALPLQAACSNKERSAALSAAAVLEVQKQE